MGDTNRELNLSSEELNLLSDLNPVMEKHADAFLSELYSYIDGLGRSAEVLKDFLTRGGGDKMKEWFVDLFSGRYEDNYIRKLSKIGERLFEDSVPLHLVSTIIGFTRRFIHGRIVEELGKGEASLKAILVVDRVLDFSSDIIARSYVDRDLRHSFDVDEMEGFLVRKIRKFSRFLGMFLIVFLLLSSVLIIYWVGIELYHIFSGTLPLKEGVLSILGSILILYALSELINEEVKHLKGAPFSVKAFLGVALAAIIREILVLSVSHADVEKMLSMGFLLLTLGAVFWLTSKEEKAF